MMGSIDNGLLLSDEKLMRSRICSGAMTEQECLEMQLGLQRFVVQEQVIEFSEIHTVAGVDLAYWKTQDMEYAVCCIAVIDAVTQAVLERIYHMDRVVFPYIPGYLAFRELPLVLEAVRELKLEPDIFMFDGNGILHPRRMGLAAQASVFLRKPALGVAKTYYRMEDAVCGQPGKEAGAYSDITVSGEVLGRVLRTHKGVAPVYVSVGNYMNLEGATRLVMSQVERESHVPVPTREADMDTHKMRGFLRGREQEELAAGRASGIVL